METIKAWLHSSLTDTQQPANQLYKEYTKWCQIRTQKASSFSLFKTTIGKINLFEFEGGVETEVETEIVIPEIKQVIEPIQILSAIEPEIVETSDPEMDEEQIFQQIENYTASVCDSSSKDYALIVSGDPGLGKTVSVTKVFNQLVGKESEPRQFFDIEETNEYVFESSEDQDEIQNLEWINAPVKITPLQLYIYLYRENGKILLFDDADCLIEDSSNFDILKKVLDSKKSRSVGYGSKPIILKKASIGNKDVIIPNSFEFTGRIVIVTNRPFKKIDSAIKSRSLVVEVDLSATQCLKRVKRLLPYLCEDEPRATIEVKQEVLDYLLSISDLFKKIDLRTTEQSIREYFRSPSNWKSLVKQSILLKNK
jgi:hypothetical protein